MTVATELENRIRGGRENGEQSARSMRFRMLLTWLSKDGRVMEKFNVHAFAIIVVTEFRIYVSWMSGYRKYQV